MFLDAQAVPALPRFESTRTPLPGNPFHPAPRAALSDSAASALQKPLLACRALQPFRVRACLNISAPPNQEPLLFAGIFGCQLPLTPLSILVSLTCSAYKSCWFSSTALAPSCFPETSLSCSHVSALPRPPTGLPFSHLLPRQSILLMAIVF